jgi:hypothetical protein
MTTQSNVTASFALNEEVIVTNTKPISKLQAARAKAKAAKATKAKAIRQKTAKAKALQERASKEVSLATLAKDLKTPRHVIRAEAVTAGKRFEGATRRYAAALIRDFGAKFWEVSSQKGKLSENEAELRKAVRHEQAACKALAESRGLKNIYKPWSDALLICKNPEGKKGKAAATRPVPERINIALLAAFKLAHVNYETFEKNEKYTAVYDALEALCKKAGVNVKAITDVQ